MIFNKRELTPEELAKPYAKYYDKVLAEPDPEVLAKFEHGPMDPENALDPEHINDLLDPDIPIGDLGYCVMSDGVGYVASGCDMPGVTLDMIRWWMCWHPLEDLRYMIWFPGSHYKIKLDDEARQRILDPDIPMDEKIKNITHYSSEDILVQGNDYPFFCITFVPPEDAGIDPDLYEAADDVLVLAVVSSLDEDLAPDRYRILVHVFRQTDDGVRLETRSWRGCTLVDGKKVVTLPEGTAMDVDQVLPITQHMLYEFTNLASFLPQLYQEMDGKIEE